MAKSFSFRLLRNNLGQSAVEYIMLLAVISSISYAFYNNKKFKDFISGKDGLFETLRKGMGYSYRYGLEYSSSKVEYDKKMEYMYDSKDHDTYYNKEEGNSHFFSGSDPYPE
jgi:hypothetical protein